MNPLSLAGLGGGLLGGIFDLLGGNSNQARGVDSYKQAIEQLRQLGVPDIEAQKIVLQKAQQSGEYTPELEQAISQGNTELANITEDPMARQAQVGALTSLQDIAANGGQSLADKAALQDTLGQVAQQERGGRERIAQSMAERGISNSGLGLAAQLANQQNAAQNANSQGLNIAGMAQQRALQALQEAGQLGGNLRSQDFNQASQVASAQDSINRFNAANTADTQMRNAAAKNSGSQYNLERGDKYNMYNNDLGNKQEVYNKGLYQQDFQNRQGVANKTADLYSQQGANLMGQQSPGVGTQIGAAAGGLASAIFGGKKKKEEDEE